MAKRHYEAPEDERDEFYEAMPATSTEYVEAESSDVMSWQQIVSLVAGLGLLFATLGGWWSALQSNGQILGFFAFNAWTTGLSLVAAILAIVAAFTDGLTARALWTGLAVAYAVYAVIAAFIAGGQVLGLFASNTNDVWAAGLAAIVFGYLAYTQPGREY